MKELLKIRIDKRLGSYLPGTIIKVGHNNGVPLNKYWRDRIKDSEFDGCVTVIQSEAKKKPAKEKIDKEV